MARVNVVLADGYDRESFERVFARSRALRDACEPLARLLPHAEALVCDLYCVLFKLNVVLRDAGEIAPAALVNRSVIESVMDSDGIGALRNRTALDETTATVATTLLARRVLELLRQAFRNQAYALVNAADSARNEEELETVRAHLEHLENTPGFDSEAAQVVADELRGEVKRLQARLRRDRKRQHDAAKIASAMDGAIDSAVKGLQEHGEASQQHARGLGIGGAGTVDADRRLELGEHIMKSEKLRRLARLVGAMRELAFDTRRRRAARSPQQVHAITMGDDLTRLLPSEMLGLRGGDGGVARGLRMDFLRRFAERQLLQYRLDGPADRGPMVVCLDGSGSMQGAKELWGKAVALTLMEIARRERRRCLALIFSAGDAPFEVELLVRGAGGARARVRDQEVLRFAEHFPGGGTDFETPLTRAVEAVSEGNYRRGDVVFITDGHAHVSDALVQYVDRQRKRHRFRIRAILVDVEDHERSAVDAFADEVRSVRDLTSNAIADLFAAV